jgi:type III restriction enzyme
VVGDASWEQYAANIFEKSYAVLSYAKNDHLGFQIFYLWAGSRRRYVPDFLVRLSNGKTLVLEIKGTRHHRSTRGDGFNRLGGIGL